MFTKAIPENTSLVIQCYVTGSNLSGVRIHLTKDGAPLDREMELVGPRPNGDGTNQMRVFVQTTSDRTGTYKCYVENGTVRNSALMGECLLIVYLYK